MRIHSWAAALGYLLVTSCVSELDLGPEAAEIRSDPSILYLGPGESSTLMVEAFLGNEPESVRWNIGMVGNGVQVAVDSTYGVTYVGSELRLPEQSHSRRYNVTMTDTVETSFVISGGTGIATIQVRPIVP